jgi:hypothetical protein
MDESSGDVEAPTGWFALYGRHMLYADSQGFISSERFESEEQARQHFELLNTRYSEWDDTSDIYGNTFRLNMTMDGAAFADNPRSEIARILRDIAAKVEGFDCDVTMFQTIHDINGNDVGRWAVKPLDY